MRRLSIAAALALVGMLAMAGGAGANVGDVQSVEIDDTLEGSADQVTVSGTVECALEIDYGVIVKATQPPELAQLGELSGAPETGTGDQGDADAEGAAAFGPDRGNEANTPCTTGDTPFDVVVEKNVGSDDFSSGDMGVELQAATSANDGDRGPGPFIGDVETVFEVVEFDDGSTE